MDVAAHQLTGTQHFLRCKSTANGECLVHTHQPLNPGIDEQVVANANLYCRGIISLHQEEVKESGVEHNIAMVAHESIAQRLVAR